MSEREHEVSIAGNLYKLSQDPRRVDQERYPGRINTGNLIESDEVKAPSWVMQDFSGGQGVFLMDASTQSDRYWSGIGEFRTSHFGLPPLAHDAKGADFMVLAEFQNAVYGFDSHAWKRDDANNTWVDKGAIAGTACSWIEYKNILIVGCGADGYSYSTDGTTWHDYVASGAISFTIFDLNLIKIDNFGHILYSTDGTTWTDLLDMPYPPGSYQKLFIYFNLSGEPCIYVAHKRGFDWIDFTNKLAYPTGLMLPKHPYGGKASGVWRGDYAFYGAGLAAYSFVPGTVRAIGMDRDDGVPADMRGVMVDLAGGDYGLYIALDNTLASTPSLLGRSTRFHFNAPKIMNASVGFSYLMEYTGTAWHAKWQSGVQASPIRCLLLSDAYAFRLWWVADGHVWYMDRPLGVADPYMSIASQYGLSSQVITPWFRGNSAVDAKAALLLSLTTEGAANGTVTVSYGLDGSEAWTQLGQYISDTIPDIPFGLGAGMEFERIRFKFDLVRTSTDATDGIWVVAMKLRYRHALPKLKSWSVTIDCTAEYGGLQPRQQISLISEYAASHVLVPFIFEYPPVTHWVDVNIQGQETTGRVRKALYQIILSECV